MMRIKTQGAINERDRETGAWVGHKRGGELNIRMYVVLTFFEGMMMFCLAFFIFKKKDQNIKVMDT